MVNASTFNTFYDDVRVPDSAIIGELNRGWDLIVNQLNYERVGAGAAGDGRGRATRTVVDWAQGDRAARRRARRSTSEWVQLNLARVKAGLEFLQPHQLEGRRPRGRRPARQPGRRQRRPRCSAPSSSLEAYRLLMEVLGPGRLRCRKESPGAVLAGRLDRAYQGTLILTFGGGVNEIQRDLIAMFGLGMPRTPRM